jgi:hypothetical protein
MVDVLRKFVADRLAHLRVGFTDKIVGSCKPADVGYALERGRRRRCAVLLWNVGIRGVSVRACRASPGKAPYLPQSICAAPLGDRARRPARHSVRHPHRTGRGDSRLAHLVTPQSVPRGAQPRAESDDLGVQSTVQNKKEHPVLTSRRPEQALLSNQAWKSLRPRDWRRVPFAGKRIRLRSVEPHCQIERAFRSR